MGPAPQAGKRPAMPGPRRLVRRSIVLGMGKGWSRLEAAANVLWVIERCQGYLDLAGSDLAGWFAELHAEALAQVQVSTSPTTHRQESDHGDRSTRGGRRAGAS